VYLDYDILIQIVVQYFYMFYHCNREVNSAVGM